MRIQQHLAAHFPGLAPVPMAPGATATDYAIPGHAGHVGIIAAYSRTFCGTCNRLRLTPEGGLKTCLYEHGALDVRALLRGGATDEAVTAALAHAFRHRAANGFAAEQQRPVHQLSFESMATIGGLKFGGAPALRVVEGFEENLLAGRKVWRLAASAGTADRFSRPPPVRWTRYSIRRLLPRPPPRPRAALPAGPTGLSRVYSRSSSARARCSTCCASLTPSRSSPTWATPPTWFPSLAY